MVEVKYTKSTVVFVALLVGVMSIFAHGFFVSPVYAQTAQDAVPDPELQKLIDQAEDYGIPLDGDETKDELKDLIKDYEDAQDEKDDLKDDLKKVEKKKKNLEQTLNTQYATLTQQRALVAKTEAQVQAKADLITQYESELARLESEQDLQRSVLQTTLRQLYYAGSDSVTKNLFEESPTTQFLLAEDRLQALREDANTSFSLLSDLHKKAGDKRQETAAAKKEHEQLLAQQQKQEQAVASAAAHTSVAVQRAAATIAELNAKLASVEANLSSLLGKSFDTNDIVDAAKFASKKTGVRKDFILGMLTQETSLGRFTGGCTYKKSKMGSSNAKIFKRITKALGYNYKKKKVSCPLSYGIGGAMGVAQFMPSTWAGYESSIAKYTGHNPADPWSLTDGVMAMAVKLKNDGGAKKSGENTAARRYYCGSNISRTVCANYAANVLYWADNYQRLLK